MILLLESILYGAQGDEQLAASRTREGFGNITGQILEQPGRSGTLRQAPGAPGVVSRRREDGSEIGLMPNVVALHALGVILGGVLEDAGERNEVSNAHVVLNAAALEHLLREEPEDLSAARKLFSRVLEMAEASGDELLIAQTHERIAGAYRREKNYPQALEHYRKSLQVIERARLPLTFKLTEVEPTTVGVLRNIARIHAASGDYEQALASYQKILDRGGSFYRLLDTALLYEVAEINFKLGRYGEVLTGVEQALAAAARGGDRDMLWKLHTLAGRAYRALKQDAPAARSFAKAIGEVEASRSRVVGGGRNVERFFEDKLGPYLGAHGFLDDDDPMYSRIVLSRAERSVGRVASAPPTPSAEATEDGLLEAWEIMDLELNANLVILSACETARGRIGDGEGIVGLTWALFMAGVPTTVVSQWKVDEGATTELMYLFNENFVKAGSAAPGQPRKAEALRQASLKLIGSEKYRHPYYWAGFVLAGDGN